jgi:endoglucanase
MQLNRRAAAGLMLAGLATPALGTAPSPGVKVPTRGFALPDWLSASPRVPAPALLEALRSAGFETIRLPMDPTYVTPDSLVNVAGVLQTVTKLGFNAILDLHPEGKIEPPQISRAWELLTPVLAETSPDQVYAELLNEPPMDAARWRPLRDRLAAGIRRRAPRHPLIWGPARYQGIWELDATGPLADDNSIVAIHYYAPMAFTHQCENWDDSPLAQIHNLPFPANRRDAEVVALAASLDASDRAFLETELQQPWTVARIDRDFGDFAAWAGRHRTAAMLGEFGVLNFCVDAESRARWVRSVRLAAETNGLGWTYWEVDQGFGFVADRSSASGIYAGIVAALI